MLTEQRMLGTLLSGVIIGMLIAQDIAVVPLLILLPKLGNVGEGLAELGTPDQRAAFSALMRGQPR
jgi:CPA2 family monovalent cation:H+ antiporter-2